MGENMRNNKIKILVLLLAVCLLISMLPLGTFAAEDEQTRVVAYQLSLGDDLTMRFKVQISQQHQADGIMTLETNKGRIAEYVVAQQETNEEGYYIFSIALNALQMTEDITLRLVCGDVTVLEETCNIRDYALSILNGKYTNETKVLVKRMLNYGAAAQVYFDYNTENLANKGYEQAASAVVYEEAPIEISGNVNGIKYYGSSLSLESKVAVYHYFIAPEGISDYTITVDGKVYVPTQKDGMYRIKVTGINPQHMNTEMTVAATDGVDTMSFQYVPTYYINRMYNKQDTTQELKNLLAAASSYFVAAEKFDGVTAGDISLKANGDHVYPLNEKGYSHFRAQATLSVSAVREGVSPRVGLRLTNSTGATLDFVIAYKNTQELWENWLLIVETDAAGKEFAPQWKELTGGVTTGEDTLISVTKEFENIKVYFGDTLALEGQYAGFGADSVVTVSLYSRYTDTQFLDYGVKAIDMPDSSVSAYEHIYLLNDNAHKDITAHTTLTVSQAMNGISSRVGLRLTNESGMKLDYVLAYKDDTTFWADWLLIVLSDATGKETIEWIDLETDVLPNDDDVVLRVRKVGDAVRFYVNDTWVFTKTFAGFGAENSVTASLYSKGTTTDFADYNATALKAADAIMEDGSHSYAIDSTAYTNIEAQTELSISGVMNGVSARSGLRLTNESGLSLDYVLAYKNDTTFWADWLLVVLSDATGKETIEWIDLNTGVLPDDDNVVLKVKKVGDTVQFYLNGTLVHTKAYMGFGAENNVAASLYSKHTTTSFNEYTAKPVYLEDSDVENSNHQYAISDAAYESFAAQTTLTVSQVQNGAYARSGLRLINQDGRTLDCVIAYNNNATFWSNGFYIVTTSAGVEDPPTWVNLDASILSSAENVTIKVEKLGNTLKFYVNGTLGASGSYDGFGIYDQVTAALYSKSTATDFSNYSVTQLHPENANLETANHMYAISSAAVNVTSKTDLTVSAVKDGVYARVGLRLTNSAGQMLDYVIAYDKNTTFWPDGFYIVTTDATGKETTRWIAISKDILPDAEDVTMKVEKTGETLKFYMGDTLVLTNTYAGFGAEDAVTVYLYSKYATTEFANYGIS